MWIYKYDAEYNRNAADVFTSGIGLHADDAQINMNVWLTKSGGDDQESGTESNGGLLLYPELKSDRKDSFATFNHRSSTESTMHRKVNNKETQVVEVLHKSNRLVLFDSYMYHQSAAGMNSFGNKFDEGRVNLTLLFGRRKDSRNVANCQ